MNARLTSLLFATLLVPTLALAGPSIQNKEIQNVKLCEMKNLDVPCEKGDSIELDVTRANNDVFLTIKNHEALGDYVMLYINGGSSPSMLKMEGFGRSKANVKRAKLPMSILSKLKNASSLKFVISMKKRQPITGSLGQYHFNWLTRFGSSCS